MSKSPLRTLTIFALLCVACLSLAAQNTPRTVHVFVALADNQNQGIVPVPAKLGNGQDPAHNLYWGSAYGVKTYFSHASQWMIVSCVQEPKSHVVERCTFRHRTQNVYLVADAYQGNAIQTAILDFLDAASGLKPETISVSTDGRALAFTAGGGANLIAYVGHDGLMDFTLPRLSHQQNYSKREAVILACASKSFFAEPLRATGAYPALWTTGLMAPEAYTLKAALDGWVNQEDYEQIRNRAAAAYNQYQHCGVKAARRLLATGW